MRTQTYGWWLNCVELYLMDAISVDPGHLTCYSRDKVGCCIVIRGFDSMVVGFLVATF